MPDDYQPDKEVLDFAAQYGDKFQMTNQPLEAAKDADVVITDVWASMGQEGEAEKRRKAFHGYQINDDVMAQAHADAMVLHCLPAHREEEITTKVFEHMPTRSLRRPRTVCTHRRQLWSS